MQNGNSDKISTGFATFIYDVTIGLPLNHLGFYGTTTGSFAQINEPLINCCIDFIGLKGIKQTPIINIPKSISESFLNAYPNPNSGELLTLNYQFKNSGNVQLNIADIMGKPVYKSSIFIPNPKIKIKTVLNLKQYNFQPGLYFVRLGNGNEILSNKLIIVR